MERQQRDGHRFGAIPECDVAQANVIESGLVEFGLKRQRLLTLAEVVVG